VQNEITSLQFLCLESRLKSISSNVLTNGMHFRGFYSSDSASVPLTDSKHFNDAVFGYGMLYSPLKVHRRFGRTAAYIFRASRPHFTSSSLVD
jgi:hypothetical protein